MRTLPTWWYRTEYFFIGKSNFPILELLFYLLTFIHRLSPLGDDASTETLLHHASVILDSTVDCIGTENRETTKGFQGARSSPHRDALAHRVGIRRKQAIASFTDLKL